MRSTLIAVGLFAVLAVAGTLVVTESDTSGAEQSTCIACHDDEPLMAAYELPTGQGEVYR